MFQTHNAVRLENRSPDCHFVTFIASTRLTVPLLCSGIQQWLSLYDSCKYSPRGTQLTVFNTSRLALHNYLNKWTASCVFLKGHGLHSRKTETNRIAGIVPWAQLFSKTLLAGGVTVQGDKSQTCLREVCANEREGCLTFWFGYTR